MINVKIKKLAHFDESLPLPDYASSGAAGADIRSCLGKGEELIIRPGERVLVPTGISLEIPVNYEIQVRPRSGLSYKTGLMVVNAPGTIDSDYRGEIKIVLGNLGSKEEVIHHGDRIAQLVLAPVIQSRFVEERYLSSTSRDVGGFGSTGIN